MLHNPFSDKNILLGVTGSIAAYKAATLASLLTKAGAAVDVILTAAAEEFVTPLTFQTLTGRPVYTSMWKPGEGQSIGAHIAHVGLGHQADLLIIAPATANTLAKITHGIADNLLSVTSLAARCPVLLAPAMDAGMYDHPATQANVAVLQERGVHFAGPTTGRMASGLEGLGRMIEAEAIFDHCRMILAEGGPLAGRRVVVSAGPTQEALDPVRFISNHSSGKQGFAIAQAAADAGANVTLIAGPVSMSTPAGVNRVDVHSADEMSKAVLDQATGEHAADVLIMAAAVADFRPEVIAEQKIKKLGQGTSSISLAANPDILMTISKQAKRPRLVIGFAAESENLIANAQEKLARKKLDMIVANDISTHDAGFATDTNRVHLITPQGIKDLPLMGKGQVAGHIMDWVVQELANR